MITFTNQLRAVSEKCKDSLSERVNKLFEEGGEVSAEASKMSGAKPTEETAEQVRQNFIEECCDSLIVASDLLLRVGATEAEIAKIVSKKLTKWDVYLDKKIKAKHDKYLAEFYREGGIEPTVTDEEKWKFWQEYHAPSTLSFSHGPTVDMMVRICEHEQLVNVFPEDFIFC